MLLASALAAAIIFGKARTLSWPLVFFLGGLNSIMAFWGGFEAHLFSGKELKIVLSIVLAVAGTLMLFPEKERRKTVNPGLFRNHHYYRGGIYGGQCLGQQVTFALGIRHGLGSRPASQAQTEFSEKLSLNYFICFS